MIFDLRSRSAVPTLPASAKVTGFHHSARPLHKSNSARSDFNNHHSSIDNRQSKLPGGLGPPEAKLNG